MSTFVSKRRVAQVITVWGLLTVCPLMAEPDTPLRTPAAEPTKKLPTPPPLSIESSLPADSSTDFIQPIVPPQEDDLFQLREIILHGNTVFGDDILLPLFNDLIGEVVHTSDLYGVANRITAFYQEHGYSLSQALVPGQAVTDGRVELWVVEGAFSSFRIEGEMGEKLPLINRYAEQIVASKPLNQKDLERYLLLINDIPGIHAYSYILPGDNGLLDAELVIQTHCQQLSSYMGVDNRGSKFFGRDQLYGGVRLNNLFGRGEQLELSTMVSDASDPKSVGGFANLHLPIFDNGSYLQIYAAASETKPGGRLAQFNLEGEAIFGSVAYGYPLIREMKRYLYVTGQLDYVDASETINNGEPFIEDKLTVARTALTFYNQDRLGGDNYAGVRLTVGIDGLGTQREGDPFSSRVNAEHDFMALQISATRWQPLSFLSENLSLLVGVEGQYSNDSLPSSEEYGLGGSTYLRGYDYYEVAGDKGFASRGELQYDWSFRQNRLLHALQGFVYFDYGKIANNSSLDFEFENATLASAGGGLRANLTRNLFASFYVAKPLRRNVIASQRDEMRYFLQIVMSI